jgi:hypothetical protein
MADTFVLIPFSGSKVNGNNERRRGHGYNP